MAVAMTEKTKVAMTVAMTEKLRVAITEKPESPLRNFHTLALLVEPE